METNEEFENAVREIYPYHYFMIDDYKRGQLRKMFEAGERQGMERAAEIVGNEDIVEAANSYYAQLGDAEATKAAIVDAIRKEIKP